MNMYRTTKWLAVIGTLLLVAMLAVVCTTATASAAPAAAPAAPAPITTTEQVTATEPTTDTNSAGCVTHMADGSGAPMHQWNNMRGIRYCEISLICGDKASIYDTSGLNNEGNPMDTCQPDLWVPVDPTAEAIQYDVPAVWKNGPRFWTNDQMELPVGAEPLNFNGLDFAWFANPSYPPNIQNLGITAGSYVTTTVPRNSVMTFTAGMPLYILVDPSGAPWVMQAAAQIVNPDLTYGDLMYLDSQLGYAPEGWSYQVKTVDQDLVIKAVDGFAVITQDDLGNSYDGCIELNGGQTCNFDPLTADGYTAPAPAPARYAYAPITTTEPTTDTNSAGCVTHMADGSGAPMHQWNNMRGIRYCEISLICGDKASMYNTFPA